MVLSELAGVTRVVISDRILQRLALVPIALFRTTMVYINSWQEYQEAAENLYAKSPRKVRPPTPFKLALAPIAHRSELGRAQKWNSVLTTLGRPGTA